MLTYCLKCKRNTKNIDAKMIKTKNGRLNVSSKCAACGSNKSRFKKEQEAEGLLSNLHSFTKYLILTLVFMQISALPEKFIFCFSIGFC